MEITQTQKIKAIEKSIKHHEENLKLARKEKGDFRNSNCYVKIGDKTIFYGGKHCALCLLCYSHCDLCPVNNFREDECGTTWRMLLESSTKREFINAEKEMIKVLKKVLKIEAGK